MVDEADRDSAPVDVISFDLDHTRPTARVMEARELIAATMVGPSSNHG